MVGFGRESSSVKYRESDYVFAGAFSGFMTRTIFQPLDVIKIRFQLQIEPISGKSQNSKYRGTLQCIRSIVKEEKTSSLWKGIVPAQFLSVSFGALQFLAFELLTQQAKNILPSKALKESTIPVVNFTCGAVAGLVATVGSFPFDVTRTRLVAQGEPKVYRGMFHAAITMMLKEGPKSFYKGLTPTLIQIMPNAGFQFAFYKLFQGLWIYTFNSSSSETSALQSGFCGAAAGMGAKMAIYPLDLIKKRIQVQGFEEARKAFGAVRRYTGFIHCIRCIIKDESFFGLYKGLSPSILKAACSSGSHFLFYEETLKFLIYLRS